ncbi:MAG: glycosyltransferase family 39 protein [Acidobacteriaceae bacterium]|nr:glycosyltransferase family 39 protein [Acidobacteriaceae bacterium]
MPADKVRATRGRFGAVFCFLIAFTALYFTQACLIASEKFFWFDELCTLYICRLPSFHETWQAAIHGADYNPPLFYLIERTARALLGEGLIAMRLPAMIGVWLCCICLFRIVGRRVGLVGGVIALLFPLCTLAAYYACEARSHGIVLGFFGLSLVCWDELQVSRRNRWWQAGFALTLGAALLTHCYAILILLPFAVIELWRVLRVRHVDWGMWAALLIPAVVAVLCFVPLSSAYRVNLASTGFAYQFRPEFWQIHFFYLMLLSPAISVVAAALMLLPFVKPDPDRISREHLALSIGFAVLPIAGVVFASAAGGPFIPRYFLSAAVGLALLLGFGFGSGRRVWMGLALVCVMAAVLGRNFGSLLAHRHAGMGQALEEPSTKTPLNTTPGQPLADYGLLLSHLGEADSVVITQPMDFLYLVYYAPKLIPRMYYLAWSTDETNYRLYRKIREWCHVEFNPVSTFAEFVPQHRRFLVYGDWLNLKQLSELRETGAETRFIGSDDHHYLAEAEFRNQEIIGRVQHFGGGPHPESR